MKEEDDVKEVREAIKEREVENAKIRINSIVFIRILLNLLHFSIVFRL